MPRKETVNLSIVNCALFMSFQQPWNHKRKVTRFFLNFWFMGGYMLNLKISGFHVNRQRQMLTLKLYLFRK